MFLSVRKEFMKEVILVIIRGIGLFTRLNKRGKKKNPKNKKTPEEIAQVQSREELSV